MIRCCTGTVSVAAPTLKKAQRYDRQNFQPYSALYKHYINR